MHKKTGSSRVGAVLIGSSVLVLAGGVGGATAAKLIESSDIKNQTIRSADIGADAVATSELRDGGIRLRDMSEAAQAALKGNAGTDGAPGVSGYNQQFEGPVDLDAGDTVGAEVDCSGDDRVLGGGGSTGGGASVTVIETRPLDANTWYVRYANTSNTDYTFVAWATCADVT